MCQKLEPQGMPSNSGCAKGIGQTSDNTQEVDVTTNGNGGAR